MPADWLDGVKPLTEGDFSAWVDDNRTELERAAREGEDATSLENERRLLATVAELRAEVARAWTAVQLIAELGNEGIGRVRSAATPPPAAEADAPGDLDHMSDEDCRRELEAVYAALEGDRDRQGEPTIAEIVAAVVRERDEAAARLPAPPQPSAVVAPEEVREAARETLEVYDLPEHTKTMAHWILSLPAPPEPRD